MCIVDIPKFDGNVFSMVVKYHVITRANLVGRTQFSDHSQRACVYFRLRPFEEIKKKTYNFCFCLSARSVRRCPRVKMC